MYDSQRVENLKKTLIKTLAHASNIRMRRPQDVITLVVGALDETRSWGPGRRPGPMTGGGGSWSTLTLGQPEAGSARAAVRNPAGALLVLRVTKADVDALAKGQLTPAQFAEKVQSLWAPLDQGTPETEASPGRRKNGIQQHRIEVTMNTPSVIPTRL